MIFVKEIKNNNTNFKNVIEDFLSKFKNDIINKECFEEKITQFSNSYLYTEIWEDLEEKYNDEDIVIEKINNLTLKDAFIYYMKLLNVDFIVFLIIDDIVLEITYEEFKIIAK